MGHSHTPRYTIHDISGFEHDGSDVGDGADGEAMGGVVGQGRIPDCADLEAE